MVKKQFLSLLSLSRQTGFFFYLTIFALIATSLLTLFIPFSFRILIDQGIQNPHNHTIFLYLSLLALSLGAATALRYYAVNLAGEKIFRHLRLNIFQKILSFSPYEIEKFPINDIYSCFTSNAETIRHFSSTSLSIASRNILLLLGGFIMMFLTEYRLALSTLVIMPLLLIPIIFFGKRLKKQSHITQDTLSQVNHFTLETFEGLETIQNFTRQSFRLMQFSQNISKTVTQEKQRIFLRSFLTFIVISLVFLSIVLVIYYGASLIYTNAITAGTLMQFLLYAIFTAGATSSLSDVWGDLQRASHAYQQIQDILCIKPLINPKEGLLPATPLKGKITFHNIYFSYPQRPKNILENFSLTLLPKEKIILMGPSGVGKSTLFTLLLKHRFVQSGDIFFDEYSIKDLSANYLRRHISLVSQNITLFTGSIFDNIALDSKDNIPLEKVIDAAKKASIHDFILSLEKGYDTHVGVKGMELSGGQRQRLSLARAFLKQAPILLCDEPTSALDKECAETIFRTLTTYFSDKTILVITHTPPETLYDFKVISL